MRILGDGTLDGKQLAWEHGITKTPVVMPPLIESGTTSKDDDEGTADFHWNCHGYAFHRDGLSRFKLNIQDHNAGAQRVLDSEFYEGFTPGTEAMKGDLMYMCNHMNYIDDDSGPECYQATKIMFKIQASQVFTFTYPSAGRDHRRKWNGIVPSYHKRVP